VHPLHLTSKVRTIRLQEHTLLKLRSQGQVLNYGSGTLSLSLSMIKFDEESILDHVSNVSAK